MFNALRPAGSGRIRGLELVSALLLDKNEMTTTLVPSGLKIGLLETNENPTEANRPAFAGDSK